MIPHCSFLGESHLYGAGWGVLFPSPPETAGLEPAQERMVHGGSCLSPPTDARLSAREADDPDCSPNQLEPADQTPSPSPAQPSEKKEPKRPWPRGSTGDAHEEVVGERKITTATPWGPVTARPGERVWALHRPWPVPGGCSSLLPFGRRGGRAPPDGVGAAQGCKATIALAWHREAPAPASPVLCKKLTWDSNSVQTADVKLIVTHTTRKVSVKEDNAQVQPQVTETAEPPGKGPQETGAAYCSQQHRRAGRNRKR